MLQQDRLHLGGIATATNPKLAGIDMPDNNQMTGHTLLRILCCRRNAKEATAAAIKASIVALTGVFI